MKIAILGTRGIPNTYGGFEQFAEYLSQFLVSKGHDVFVYNSSNNPYKETLWRKVKIITKYDPENRLGSFSQFLYDFNCIKDSRERNYDVILQLGYTSSSIWGKLFPKKSILVTNMDGLEWKRSKYNYLVRSFLKYAERLAIRRSDYLISDSKAIQEYIQKKYAKNSTYIPYGAEIFNSPATSSISTFNVEPFTYSMLIARLEPENNIEIILKGVINSQSSHKFLVIGNYETKFGNYLKAKYKDKRIKFLGSIYNLETLNNLRYYSAIYFHGHSVGGTNPSLLEAMASSSLICANDNPFNKNILGDDAFYFNNEKDIEEIIDKVIKGDELYKIKNNLIKIEDEFSWIKVNAMYEQLFINVIEKNEPQL